MLMVQDVFSCFQMICNYNFVVFTTKNNKTKGANSSGRLRMRTHNCRVYSIDLNRMNEKDKRFDWKIVCARVAHERDFSMQTQRKRFHLFLMVFRFHSECMNDVKS